VIGRRTILAGGFLAALAPGAAWPGAAWAQRARSKVGVVVPASPLAFLEAFQMQLNQLGWREGSNLELFVADAQGDPAALPRVVSAMISFGPDVIVSASNRSHIALRDATTTIPIVAVAALDPVRLGLSESLSRPSRNFTGNIGFIEELMGKRVELLREALPQAKRIGLLLDPSNPAFPETHDAAANAARQFGLSLVVLGYRSSAEILPAVDRARQESLDAIIVVPDAMAIPIMAEVIGKIDSFGLPTLCFDSRDMPFGATFVVGGDRAALWRDAAVIVDRLLRGAALADLPFSRPTKVFTAVNLRAARRLGIEVPLAIIARADEVIE
jgi:putative ABC transport system substrate-binding protein